MLYIIKKCVQNDAFPTETQENIDQSIVYADHHSESEYNIETEINNDDMEIDINEVLYEIFTFLVQITYVNFIIFLRNSMFLHLFLDI